MLLLLAAPPPALAQSIPGCSSSPAPGELVAMLDTVEARYGALDAAGFRTAWDTLEAELRCMPEGMTPQLAARVLRAQGLFDWLGRRTDLATAAFAASRTADPHGFFPLTVMPAEAPERAAYEGASAEPGALAPFAPPPVGAVSLDGIDAQARPTSRPVVYQYTDADGIPRDTRVFAAEEPFPVIQAPPPKRGGPTAGQWVGGALSVGLLATGGIVYASGLSADQNPAYRQLCPAEGANSTDCKAARAYYDGTIYPTVVTGIGLMVAGGAGLAGTGVWIALTDGGASVGMGGRW